jgi:predicted nucleotidyltransferase
MQTKESPKRLAHIAAPIARIIQSFAAETKYLLKEQVIAAYLFGSYVTNTATPDSDIDILIIVKEYTAELQWRISGLASDYSLQYNVCISPILKDVHVWNKNRQYQTLFYQNVSICSIIDGN